MFSGLHRVVEWLRLVAAFFFWYNVVLILHFFLELVQWRNSVSSVFDQVVEAETVIQISINAGVQFTVLVGWLPWVITSLTFSQVVIALLSILEELGNLWKIQLLVVVSTKVAVWGNNSTLSGRKLRIGSFAVVRSAHTISVVYLVSHLVQEWLEGVTFGSNSAFVWFRGLVVD